MYLSLSLSLSRLPDETSSFTHTHTHTTARALSLSLCICPRLAPKRTAPRFFNWLLNGWLNGSKASSFKRKNKEERGRRDECLRQHQASRA